MQEPVHLLSSSPVIEMGLSFCGLCKTSGILSWFPPFPRMYDFLSFNSDIARNDCSGVKCCRSSIRLSVISACCFGCIQ